MKPLPTPTRLKISTPVESSPVDSIPETSKQVEENPEITPELTETPPVSEIKKEIPAASPDKETMPSDYNEENCVTIVGKKIELKPTEVRYFRNKTANSYGYLKDYPLTQIMNVEAGVLDPVRDGDQIVYDFLVASLNDKDFVRDHYNEMNADEIEQIVRIMGRLNHTDEKVDALRKNREAQTQAKH